jgi:endonuclease/exonuclease/phosphatase (EEP) superfamily protein YafD
VNTPRTPRTRRVAELSHRVQSLAYGSLILLTLAGVATCFAEPIGWFEKFTHLLLQEAVAAALLVIYFAFRRLWKPALLAVCLAVFFAWPIAQYSREVAPLSIGPEAKRGSMMVFNVFRENRTPGKVVDALLKEDLDLLFLMEVTEAWVEKLQPLARIYPHQIQASPYGNWLLSKHPLENIEVTLLDYEYVVGANDAAGPGEKITTGKPSSSDWGDNEVMFATVLIDGKRIRFGGIHPPTPKNHTKIWLQRAQASHYMKGLSADPDVDATILAGDFNTSSFSPTFRKIMQTTGLRDASRGFGCVPTWGPRIPFEPILPLLGVPIDHFLVSDQLKVLSYETGPALGSDHRWVKLKWTLE